MFMMGQLQLCLWWDSYSCVYDGRDIVMFMAGELWSCLWRESYSYGTAAFLCRGQMCLRAYTDTQPSQLRWDPGCSVGEGQALRKRTGPATSLRCGLVNVKTLAPHNHYKICYGTTLTSLCSCLLGFAVPLLAFLCTLVCLCVYVYMCVCVFACVCVFF